jgi:hypothetical protein
MLNDWYAGRKQDAVRGSADGADVVEVGRVDPNPCATTRGTSSEHGTVERLGVDRALAVEDDRG